MIKIDNVSVDCPFCGETNYCFDINASDDMHCSTDHTCESCDKKFLVWTHLEMHGEKYDKN